MATTWFCKVEGQEVGPLSSSQLMTMAQRGELGPDDQVRKGDSTSWTPAARVTGLKFGHPTSAATPAKPNAVAPYTAGSATVQSIPLPPSPPDALPYVQTTSIPPQSRRSTSSSSPARPVHPVATNDLTQRRATGQVDPEVADDANSVWRWVNAIRSVPRPTLIIGGVGGVLSIVVFGFCLGLLVRGGSPRPEQSQVVKGDGALAAADASTAPPQSDASQNLLAFQSRCDTVRKVLLKVYIQRFPRAQDAIGDAMTTLQEVGDRPIPAGPPKNLADGVKRGVTIYIANSGLVLMEATAHVTGAADPSRARFSSVITSMGSDSHMQSIDDSEKYWASMALIYTLKEMGRDSNPYHGNLESQAMSNGPQPLGRTIAEEYRRVRLQQVADLEARYQSLVRYGLQRFGPPDGNANNGSGGGPTIAGKSVSIDRAVGGRIAATRVYWQQIAAAGKRDDQKAPGDPEGNARWFVTVMMSWGREIDKLDTTDVDPELVTAAADFSRSTLELRIPPVRGRDRVAEVYMESMVNRLKTLNGLRSTLEKRYGVRLDPLIK